MCPVCGSILVSADVTSLMDEGLRVMCRKCGRTVLHRLPVVVDHGRHRAGSIQGRAAAAERDSIVTLIRSRYDAYESHSEGHRALMDVVAAIVTGEHHEERT